MAVLKQIEQGMPLAEINPHLASAETKFYVLGLSPNAARIAIRFWQANTFAYFAENLRRHYLDLRIEPAQWNRPPSVWSLLLQTTARRPSTKRKSEDIPPTLGGAVLRAILSGQPYPQTLFGQILSRIRADRKVNGLRAAILKACLTRTYNEAIPVSLDVNEMNRAYRLGRLFAVLEAAQYAGVGKTNAPITDKFISAASATPNRVFPLLLRGSQHHLSSAKKKGRVGRAIRLEKEKARIIEGLDAQEPFPLTLQLADQGKFFVGFYHQQQELFVPREAGEKLEDMSPAGDDNGEE
jgi:CRISPR-associated protein Csd1